MRKIIAVLVLVAILVGSSSNLFSHEPDRLLHTQCLYPTILVTDGAGTHGTGVIVKSEKVNYGYLNVAITCDHVVDNIANLKVVIATYKDWSIIDKSYIVDAQVYHSNNVIDMSILLFVTASEMPVAKIAMEDKLYIGSDIIGFGCGMMRPPRLDFGKITMVSKTENLQSNMFVIPGDSGGPVFHNYRLIGLKRAFHQVNVQGQFYPGFHILRIASIDDLKAWDIKQCGTLSFVYKVNTIPKMTKILMKHKLIFKI